MDQADKNEIFRLQTQCHYVYFGLLYFFSSYFNLHIYDNNRLSIPFGTQNKIKIKKSYGFRKMFYNFVIPPIKCKQKNKLKIVGDVLSNSMCLYYLFAKNTIFYSEFYMPPHTRWLKKIIFLIVMLPFRQRKFFFLTKRSYDTFSMITRNRFYLPTIYYGNIFKKEKKISLPLKILVVAKLGDRRKNIRFLLDVLTAFKDKSVYIGLCGKMNTINSDFPHDTNNYDFTDTFNHYKKIFGNKLTYHGVVNHNELDKIYEKYDLFILPSKFETIGAVVLEAMAQSKRIYLYIQGQKRVNK